LQYCKAKHHDISNIAWIRTGFIRVLTPLLPEWIDKTSQSDDGEARLRSHPLLVRSGAGFSRMQLPAMAPARRCDCMYISTEGAEAMSKSQDSKKATKKEPTKTLKEKREAKKVKQEEKKRQ
jgi:hypothetical protein